MSNNIIDIKENKNFSGWFVVLGCFLLMLFSTSLVSGTAALFMAPISAEFGFKTAEYSIINLIASFTGAISAIILAPLMQKGNMKKIMLLCVLVASVTYASIGFSSKLWHFFLVSGICNFALAGLSQLPISMLVTNWFIDKRSIAIGIAFSGGGLGGAVWSALFGNIIKTGDWRICYFLGGGVIFLFAGIIILVFIKKSPSMYDQEPYVDDNTSKTDKKNVWFGVDKKLAVKTISFLFLVLAMFFLGTISAGVATHSINYLVSIGWEIDKASIILSIYSLTSIMAMFMGGIIFDKIGTRNATLISVLFTIIALFSLIMAKNTVFAYVYAITFALAMMLPRILPAIITSEVFGVKDYPSIYSYLNIFFLLGCALGSVITGIINDAVGYRVAWFMYIVFAIFLFIFTYGAILTSKKLKEKYPVLSHK